MKVSCDTIAKLNPCKDRFDNYVKHYGNREFTPRQFMGLKNITHHDKLWVAFHVLERKQITLAATDIAESVLSIYENDYPDDKRPRECIEATRLYINGRITLEQLAVKSVAAYKACAEADDSLYADPRKGYAAAFVFATATTAAYCRSSAVAQTAYAVDDESTKYVAFFHAEHRATQEKRNRTFILRYWK